MYFFSNDVRNLSGHCATLFPDFVNAYPKIFLRTI